jgi:phosphate transport system permease protein
MNNQQSIQTENAPQAGRLKQSRFGNFGDSIFYSVTLIFAASVLAVTLLIGFQLIKTSLPAIHRFGWRFLFTSTWDPVHEIYGAWPYIWGTLASSLLALILAVPVALGTAIFLVELCPQWLRGVLSFMVELLAAVPSVVYGLWGIFVMIPVLQKVQGGIALSKLSVLPIFAGAPTGYSMMAGALVLSIMILPIITAVSRDVISNVPATQREAAFGLGATHWEAVKGPILRSARSGIMGAVILGLARALGETMAITMVIGNGKDASLSLLAPANTLASILANQFAEASGLQMPSLMYIALVLFGVAILVNAIARLLLWNMSRGMKHA